MNHWLLAGAIVLFFEGVIIAAVPQTWQESMRRLSELPPQALRKIGLGMLTAAFVLLLLAKWSRT